MTSRKIDRYNDEEWEILKGSDEAERFGLLVPRFLAGELPSRNIRNLIDNLDVYGLYENTPKNPTPGTYAQQTARYAAWNLFAKVAEFCETSHIEAPKERHKVLWQVLGALREYSDLAPLMMATPVPEQRIQPLEPVSELSTVQFDDLFEEWRTGSVESNSFESRLHGLMNEHSESVRHREHGAPAERIMSLIRTEKLERHADMLDVVMSFSDEAGITNPQTRSLVHESVERILEGHAANKIRGI